MTEQSERARVIVGVDGSDSSKRALRWALDYAAAVGATVDAVMSWQYTSTYGWTPADTESTAYAEEARRVLTEAVTEVAGEHPAVTVHARVEPGHPAAMLISEAAHADLLVMGSRGLGGVTGALIGSVSQYCVQHAPCPVVIVRAQPDKDADG